MRPGLIPSCSRSRLSASTTGELDYREYVDAPPSELLNSLYSFGAGYQAAAAPAT